MSEIEKMYENCEIEFPIARLKIFKDDNGEIFTRPPFTAEKQLKILCFIVNNKHSVTFYDRVFIGDKLTLEKIQETLAWAINRIWQDLTEEEKQQIKEILE